jgi:hypothetical protein
MTMPRLILPLAFVLVCLSAPATARTELFVAPTGDDNNPGTLDKPFATLKKARDVLRGIKGSGQPVDGGFTVYLRGGLYRLSEPLHLRPIDSGTTYAAYQNEPITLSGGELLNLSWQPWHNNILMAQLPANQRDPFTQLFINNQRQPRARFPNFDPANPTVKGAGYLNATNAAKGEIYFDPTTFTTKTWAKPQEAILHIFPQHYWGTLQFEIAGLSRERNALKLGRGGYQIARDSPLSRTSRFFVENVREELDAPGEWYLDKTQGVLYCIPPVGVNLSTATVESVHLKQLIEFLGSDTQPVKDITLRGLRFAHTASVFLDDYDTPSKGDFALSRSGAVYLEGAEGCAIENCTFDAPGGNAIFVNRYANALRIVNNTITQAGESAICLVGAKSAAVAPGNNNYPRNCLISNNLIHDCGLFGKQSAGVLLSIAQQITLSHNTLYNLPRAAFYMNDGLWGGHVIEHNDLHDTGRETTDHGILTARGRDRYDKTTARPDQRATTIIRHNRLDNAEGRGIDLDEGASNFHVQDNLCLGVNLRLRDGDARLVENNIFVSPRPPGFHKIAKGNGDRFVRNIVVVHGQDVLYRFIEPAAWLKEMNHNLMFSDTGKLAVREGWGGEKSHSLEEWRKLGNDVNSLFADPQFIDPDKGDYRVKDTSPAVKLGFKNFEMNGWGRTE